MKRCNKSENKIKADKFFADLVECIEGMRDISIVLGSANTANQTKGYKIKPHDYSTEFSWENLARYF